ncbi:MAG: hypothetical protein AAGD05_08075, partial [Bacteroidota bacterium]
MKSPFVARIKLCLVFGLFCLASKSFACADAGPDTTICGFTYTLQGIPTTGTWNIVCDQSAAVTSFAPIGAGGTSITVSSCGVYQFVYAVDDGTCTATDTVNVEFLDPSGASYSIASDIDLEYNDYGCHDGNDPNCEVTNTVSIPGQTPPEFIWSGCFAGTCQSQSFQTTTFGVTTCTANNITIDTLIATGSSESCDVASQDEIINDILGYLEGIFGGAAVGLAGQCALPFNNCLPANPSPPECFHSYLDTTIYYVPIREGGRWNYVQGDTLLVPLEDTTRITVGIRDYQFIIETGATYYGPNSLDFSLALFDPNDNLVDLDTLVSIDLQWVEQVRIDTILDINPVTVDTCLVPCGGLAISGGIGQLPGPPSYDCGPVTLNFGPPDVCVAAQVNVSLVANNPILNCYNFCTEIFAQGNSNCGEVTYSWNAGGGGSSLTVCQGGVYTVIVTDENGCTASASILIDECFYDPIIDAGPSKELTCTEPCAQLEPYIEGFNWWVEWTGPNGFSSFEPAPIVCEPGVYTIYAYNFCECASTAQVLITSDQVLPTVDAGPDALLTCDLPCASLNGTASATGGLSAFWTAPDGSITNGLNTVACSPVVYTLTAVDQQNGCLNTSSTNVLLDQSSNIVNINEIICAGECLEMDHQSFCSAGVYTIVLAAANGCDSIVTLNLGVTELDLQLVSSASTLDCNQNTISIEATSSYFGNDVFYEWFSAGLSMGSTANITVNQPGNYTCIMGNGSCVEEQTIAINENTEPPSVDAGPSLQLDCNTSCVSLLASASAANGSMTYQWTGPNGFSDTQLNPSVCQPGTYTLVVTANNGCSASDVVQVDEIMAIPPTNLAVELCPGDCYTIGTESFCISGNYTVNLTSALGCDSLVQLDLSIAATDISFATPQIITCDLTSISIDASASAGGNGITYTWVGPGIMGSANNITVQVNQPGIYTLTLNNGTCSNAQSIEVLEDQNVPSVDAGPSLQLDCNTSCVSLLANASATNGSMTYQWTGPNGFSDTQLNPSVCQPGTYTLVVTANNGCS